MIYHAVKHLFPGIRDDEFALQDDSDGRGPYFARWDRPEPMPSIAQLQQVVLPIPVPQEVTKRQALQALILAGLDEQVDAMLAAMPGVEGKLARAEWKESNTVERNRPLVVQMLAALGKTPEEGDQLFIQAAGL